VPKRQPERYELPVRKSRAVVEPDEVDLSQVTAELTRIGLDCDEATKRMLVANASSVRETYQTLPAPAIVSWTVHTNAVTLGKPCTSLEELDLRTPDQLLDARHGLACDCWLWEVDPRSCPHVLSVFVALMMRRVRNASPWRQDLLRLLGPRADKVAVPKPAHPPPPHGGHVRYLLLPAQAGPATPTDLGDARTVYARREIIRLSRVDGKPLKPLKMATLDEAIEKVDGVGEADRAFQAQLDRWKALNDPMWLLGWRDYRVDQLNRPQRELLEDVLADAVLCLEGARDVHLAGEPIRVQRTLHAPVLVAADGADGTIEVGYRPRAVKAVRLGRLFVVTEDHRLLPVDRRIPPEHKDLLVRPIVVPADAAAQLVELMPAFEHPPAFVAERLRGLSIQAELAGRVELAEEGDALVARLRLAYEEGGTRLVDLAPGAKGALFAPGPGGTKRLVERDLEGERAIEAGVREAMGATERSMTGTAAVDFLVEVLPRVAAVVPVYGAQSLKKILVRGRANPRVGVATGLDWFELDVDFEIDGRTIPLADALAAWRAGLKLVRLDDGSLAQLPEQWLQRHAGALEELGTLEGKDGRTGLFALPLADELASEMAGQAALDWATLKERLAGFERVEERPLPAGIVAELRAYQRRGVDWLAFLRDRGLAGCLADDMGLGKTLMALAILVDTHATSGPPSLVVAPTSVATNWLIEAARFAPGLPIRLYHGQARGSLEEHDDGVLVTTYALLRRESAAFAAREWRYAILDEAQHIKNASSQVARAARALPARHRLALTGTPIENHLGELWSLFEFLMPGFFGSRAGFASRYATPISLGRDEHALERLRRRVRPFVLRRMKREVASELPPLQAVVRRCVLGAEQRAVYERVREAYRQSVLAAVDKEGIGGATIHVLEALTRLRQACCDPRLLPETLSGGVTRSAKLELTDDLVDELVAAGHRALVFSQWPSLLRHVARSLDTRGVDHLYLDGGTVDRQRLVDRFNAPDGPPVFLISLKAGGSGLNLTGADHVIHLDPWWNPAVEAQATDRAHRIGQTKPVLAIKIVAEHTVEEKILELQERKKALVGAAIDDDRMVVDALTREDLEAVFADPPDTVWKFEDEGSSLAVRDDRWPGAGVDPTPGAAPDPAARGATEEREAPVATAADGAAAADGGAMAAAEWPLDLDELLSDVGYLTNAMVRNAFGCTTEDARGWLKKQIGGGRLRQVGERRGTRYVDAHGAQESDGSGGE